MLRRGKVLSLCLLFTLLIALVPVGSASAAPTWNLAWSDEFDGTSLNTANWTAETGTGSGGWGNNELQFYTNREQNLKVTGGNLVITAQKENYSGMNYTSARIKTQGLKNFTYGKIEARIKLPSGQGLWPAFWMLGSNITTPPGWPACGEIDIMERVNNNAVVNGTVHWDAGGHAEYGQVTGNLDFSQYHTYSVEWDSKYIKWFVDGTQFNQFYIENGTGNTEEFQKPFFLLLNLAVGGNWPGAPNGATSFPAQMLVDYVRVYQEGAPSSGIVSGGVYTLMSKASGKVLDVKDVSTADGAKVHQWTNYTATNQQFRVDSTGDGFYKLTAIHSGKVLDVPNASTASGVQLQQANDNGSNAQRWSIVDVGGGYYKLISKASGLALDVANSSPEDGAAVQQWTDNGTDAQKWKLTKVN
ncbi:family 16 glycosylhydrolase [Paenibacillus tritici]|uniref:RICIN domain-containing protein n=1 Tax=Paenibacillus tritici TaxID=1873425 RepID=UPI001BA8EEFE|nr:RICIN domain-containing protein [Paenibacillus tritici]QUL56830.1 family 16 glycosylhydrolase [Paenibacillus tritici]